MNLDTRLSDVLHVLIHMDDADKPMTSELLAKSMGTNPAVFRRTMAGLREAGLLTSTKGHHGGWQLARPLKEITLLEVYEALGRPNLFAIGSRNRPPGCLIEKGVKLTLGETLSVAEDQITKRFREVSLDQLAPRRSAPLSIHAIDL